MNRLLKCIPAMALALACAVAIPQPANAQVSDWIAVAANDQGWGYGSGYDEEDARSVATTRCENQTGYSCGSMSTSVPNSWYLVVVNCNGSLATGASKHDYSTANYNAAIKLGYNSCRTVVQK